MKRAAIVFGILSLLMFADGIYLDVSNNAAGCSCSGDTGTLFGGSTSVFLSEGTEVLIGAGFLLLVAIIIWVVATMRRGPLASGSRQAGQAQAAPAQSAQAAQAQPGQAQAATAPAGESKTEVSAGQGQPRKESGDQH